MTTATRKLYLNAPLQNRNDDLEERTEKKDVKSFKNSFFNIKERNTYLKDKTQKSKEKYKN